MTKEINEIMSKSRGMIMSASLALLFSFHGLGALPLLSGALSRALCVSRLPTPGLRLKLI